MRKTILYAGALSAVLALSAVPARADGFGAQYLEVYPDIFGARTLLGNPNEDGVRSGFSFKASEGGKGTIVVAPIYRGQFEGANVNLYGGALGYVGQAGKNAYQLTLDIAGADFQGGDTEMAYGAALKVVVSDTGAKNQPAISLFTRWRNVTDNGQQWDFGLAADQELSQNLYGTINLGYSTFEGGGFSDFNPAVGATYLVNDRLSISANYQFDSDVLGTDFWGIQANFQLKENQVIRIGGGKAQTYHAALIMSLP